jgi:hypothetical protein
VFTAARAFQSNLEKPRSTRHGFSVQRRDSGTRFVPFHFHETEALAFAAEDVMGQVDGAHGPELAEKVSDINFLNFEG